MFHVALHNMKWHDCISYARSSHDIGVCASVWSSIISIDEWVVSSYFGRRPINDSWFKS